ncbi:MAG: 7-cyano-7-deazaguanine synthase [Promethearchaeota archaeon]
MDEVYWQKMLNLNGLAYRKRAEAIRAILRETRGYTFEIPRGEIVLILYSGGMDSTPLIDLVIKSWGCRVILLYFRRDSRNQRWEEEAVDYFNGFYSKRYPGSILELVKLDIQIPSRVNKEYLEKSRKEIMGLPMRNATMWANATTQAVYLSGKYGETIRTILVGSVPDDHDNPESGYLSVLSQSLHTCICLGLWMYQFGAPLAGDSLKPGGYTKQELVAYSKENEIPIKKSRSCFSDSKIPCGTCLACKNRLHAFAEYEYTRRGED